jgi:phytoene synthase
MDFSLAQSYDYSRALAKKSGSNFYYSFLLLPREKRDALCVVYAFMRHCDDLADSAANLDSARSRLSNVRLNLFKMREAKVVASHLESEIHNPQLFWPALNDVIDRHDIPPRHFHEVIDGVEMDLNVTRYETFEDLYRYCYCVASAVGLVCLRIFGFKSDAALLPAEHLGIAFQLTNILRDVKEDAGRGRIYLPKEDLRQFDVTESEIFEGRWSERLARLVHFEAERAESFYTRAEPLLAMVDPSSRAALVAMARIYHGILRKIQKPSFNVLARRARVTTPVKLGILAQARLAQACGATR